MKFTLFALAILGIAIPAFASDDLCVTKQKNAASFTLAQELVVPVQDVEVTAFENGVWTEAGRNDEGKDKVTVQASNRLNAEKTTKTFEVSARQIGATENCNVLNVVEVKN